MKNKNTYKVIGGVAILIVFALMLKGTNGTKKLTATETALEAIVKNDQKSFEKWVAAGGDIHAKLPTPVAGKTMTVVEAVVAHERVAFLEHLVTKKKPLVVPDMQKDFDVVSMAVEKAVEKKNPELLKIVLKEKPKLDRQYGKEGWTVMHKATAACSDATVGLIHKAGMSWDAKAKDGSSPLTLAASKSCLSVLNYWKQNKADFKAKDGAGKTTLGIIEKSLETKKDPALSAFTVSFAPTSRGPAGQPMIPNFYNKRKFPKDRLANQDDVLELEPEDRPEEAYETADYSEFSD